MYKRQALRLRFFKPSLAHTSSSVHEETLELNQQEVEEEATKMQKTIQVEGMMCQHCVAHVKNALEKIPGVQAEVSLEMCIRYRSMILMAIKSM